MTDEEFDKIIKEALKPLDYIIWFCFALFCFGTICVIISLIIGE